MNNIKSIQYVPCVKYTQSHRDVIKNGKPARIYSFATETNYEPVWTSSLADSVCPPYIKVNFATFKNLPRKERVVAQRYLREWMNQGVMVNGKRYFISGATQSSKSGMFWAYTVKGFWFQNGFDKPKDVVRGGAVHAPGTYYSGAFSVPVKFGLVPDQTTGWPVGDGVGGNSERHAAATGNPEGLQAQYRSYWAGSLKKGTTVTLHPYDDTALPFDLAVRAEDVKGAKPAEGTVEHMPWATLEIARRGEMKVGDQTISQMPESVVQAYEPEWPAIIAELHDLSRNPLKFAKFALNPLRNERNRVDVMAIMGLAAAFCQKIGSSDLMHTAGIQKMLDSYIRGENVFACLGRITSTRLMCGCWNDIVDDCVVVHPDDAPKYVHTNSIAKLLRMPDTARWRTVKIVLMDHIDTWINGHKYWFTTKGSMFMNSRTGGPQATDFDGDQDGLIWDDGRPLVTAWLDMPNETLDGKKTRAEYEEIKDVVEAMYRILQVNVGSPFSVKAKIVALRHVLREHILQLWDLIECEITDERLYQLDELTYKLGWCVEKIAVLDREGQKAVDTAKKLSIPNMDVIKEISDEAEVKGLTAMDTGWSMIAHDDITFHLIDKELAKFEARGLGKPANGKMQCWAKVVLSPVDRVIWNEKFGIYPPENGEVLLPSHITSGRTPIGRLFCDLGDQLPVPHFELRSVGEYTKRLPLLEGPGADYAKAMYEEMTAALRALQYISDDEERKEKRTELLDNWQDRTFDLMHANTPEWCESFMSQLYADSFRSNNSHQTLMWYSMPEVLFAMLEKYQALWMPVEGLEAWSGIAYGVSVPTGQYKVSCDSRKEGKNGKSRQLFHLESISDSAETCTDEDEASMAKTYAGLTVLDNDGVKCYDLMGGDKNPAWTRKGAWMANVTPIRGTKQNHISVAALTQDVEIHQHDLEDAQRIELERIDEAMKKPLGFIPATGSSLVREEESGISISGIQARPVQATTIVVDEPEFSGYDVIDEMYAETEAY